MLQSTLKLFTKQFFATTRRTLAWTAATLIGMLLFGIYLQEVVGLTPCPMCVVQRYCLSIIACLAAFGALQRRKKIHIFTWLFILLFAIAGAYVAAKQSWLQWYPPEFVSCGRNDIYGMILNMPLSTAIPKIFSGTGDCSAVEWTFLGGTIANWSFVSFTAVASVAIGWLLVLLRKRRYIMQS